MKLRPCRRGDAPALYRLFRRTVHAVALEYTRAQRAAWAPARRAPARWARSFRGHTALVAVERGRSVGFADMDETGYLDRLYVRWDRQGRGIASALCDALEAAVPSTLYTTHASRTALPFFLSRGWQVVARRRVRRRGVWMTNYQMELRSG